MLSKRTALSMSQLLGLHDPAFVNLLLTKHGLPFNPQSAVSLDQLLHTCLSGASKEQLLSVLEEILRTDGDLRARINPRYRHDQRWKDLLACLELDGYRVDKGQLIPSDPTIPQALPLDDDLSSELKRSRLPEAVEIARLFDTSAEAFRKNPPDYNGSLTDVRVALETLAKAIARARMAKHPGSFDETKWGQVLTYLRTSAMISDKQEKGIAGVYSFISAGAHVPVGLAEGEMVRLGRSLVASLCYFLIKLYNGRA